MNNNIDLERIMSISTEIGSLKEQLLGSDYQSIRDSARAMLGNMTDMETEEFRTREAERQCLRDRINELTEAINQLRNAYR